MHSPLKSNTKFLKTTANNYFLNFTLDTKTHRISTLRTSATSVRQHNKRLHERQFDVICKRGFLDKRNYNAHLANKYGAPKAFACEYCGKAFGYRKDLKLHLKKKHSVHMMACWNFWKNPWLMQCPLYI